nr:MAG TPA: hypothetical protein [Caudoviricetes sp.]
MLCDLLLSVRLFILTFCSFILLYLQLGLYHQ